MNITWVYQNTNILTNEVWGHEKLQCNAQTKNKIYVDIEAQVGELGLKKKTFVLKVEYIGQPMRLTDFAVLFLETRKKM